MPQGSFKPWSIPHTEMLNEWIVKYPKGKTINLRQIEYSEPEKLAEMAAAGHSLTAVRDKIRYIIGQRKNKAAKVIGGKRQCDQCDELFDSPQELGSHKRYAHPKGAKVQAAPPINTHTTRRTLDPAWNYCPTCGHNL